jgi:hypothetical protein
MGLFRKKTDPLEKRAQSLNRRIAELEAEIAKLNQTVTPRDPHGPSRPANPASPFAAPAKAEPASHEPVFERMPPRPLEPRAGEAPGHEAVELGLKRPVWSQWLRRMKRQMVDPPPSNEKLVNYLAAGGIQGLRPLRYERRVARNRIIFICVVLGLVLWGVLIVFWQAQ